MKKTLIALAVLTVSSASFAQSSVTISGALDAGVANIKQFGGASATNMASGIHGASRLRFVGVEDLGGGMKANFWLEMQPDFSNGTTSSSGLFNRGAWAGLSGNFGELRLGRQGTNSVAAVCDIDQMGCYSGFSGGGILFSGQGAPGAQGAAWMAANPTRGGVAQATGLKTAYATSTTTDSVQTVVDSGAAINDVQASSTGAVNQTNANKFGADSTRYVRAIRYSLPTLVQGLSANATYAMGQTLATGGTEGDSSGIDANYVAGNLKLTGAFQKAAAESSTGATGTLTTFGAIYNLGFASVGAGMQTEKATAGTTAVAFTKGSAYALTAVFPMGAVTPYIKYGQRKYSGGTLGDVTTAKVTNLGARYALSKRTYLYGDYVSNGAAAIAATNAKSMVSTGLVHNF